MLHFRGEALSSSAGGSPSRSGRAVIVASITITTILAWWYLIHLSRQMSSEMENDKMMAAMGMTMPWTAADVIFTFAMWAVMMVGMMLPAAAPVLMLYSASQAKREREAVPTFVFGLGYVTAWTAFSAAATLVQWALRREAMLSSDMATSNFRVAGGVLIAAGVYQLTPWKSKCLVHCRSPLGFLMTNWRDGALGALKMGVCHGGYCLGCCWALMLVLFAVGVMNLLWVAVLTMFILVEKIGPGGVIVGRVAGAALTLAGIMKLIIAHA